MKIYTKTGDKGTTGLIGGSRVSKDHLRIESYGTVDELNSYIGLIKDQAIENQIKEVLIRIQHDLFTLGSMLATPTNKQTLKNGEQRLNIPEVDTKSVTYLEKEIDKMNEKLPKLFSTPELNIDVNDEDILRISFSAGVTNEKGNSIDEMLNAADEHLQRAKEAGRNMVIGDE